MDVEAAAKVVAFFEKRGQLDPIEQTGRGVSEACLERSRQRLAAAVLLRDASLWDTSYTAAYDAYRTAADALLLRLGYRVPATMGGHRIAVDIAQAALQPETDAFSPALAERFRRGRHESEYFDPEHCADKTDGDVQWAVELAQRAVASVSEALSVD